MAEVALSKMSIVAYPKLEKAVSYAWECMNLNKLIERTTTMHTRLRNNESAIAVILSEADV